MQKVLLSLVLFFQVCAGFSAGEPDRLTVADYFQKLPADVFEVPAPQLWRWVQQMERGKHAVIDLPNGYIRCEGDGAQGDFTVVLFRYNDGQALIAVCQGEPAETDFWFLHFYKMAPNGKMEEVPRKIFPLPDKDQQKYTLPRQGRTVVVSDTKSGKVRARFTWDGTRFVKGS
jgi:hypothetical protein